MKKFLVCVGDSCAEDCHNTWTTVSAFLPWLLSYFEASEALT